MPRDVTPPYERAERRRKGKVGRMITNPQKLLDLADERKSVFIDNGDGTHKNQPAAFIVQMRYCKVMDMLQSGTIREWVSKLHPGLADDKVVW